MGSKNVGVVAALAKRMTEQRLPRAVALKDRVDRGQLLNDLDLAFLQEVLEDGRRMASIVEKDERLVDLAGRMLRLYREILDKALQNEQAANKGT
jgi:hypothetical protein